MKLMIRIKRSSHLKILFVLEVCEEMPPRNDNEKPTTNTTSVVVKQKKGIVVEAPKYSKSNGIDDKVKKGRLLRTNDLLAQSSTETLLDMLKANAGIKECSDETASHINGVWIESSLQTLKI